MGLSFFGLISSNISIARANLFSQIHEICFHGKGGYDWNTIYNMPTWLRRFTFNEIQKYYKDEKETLENKGKKGSQTVISSDGQIKTPEFLQKPQNNPPTFNPSTNKKPASYK